MVLSRRVGESIMIGNDIVVTVLEVRPDLVRIGIDAPRDVGVHREEVFVEVQEANRSAASPAQEDVEVLAAGLRDGTGLRPGTDDAPTFLAEPSTDADSTD